MMYSIQWRSKDAPYGFYFANLGSRHQGNGWIEVSKVNNEPDATRLLTEWRRDYPHHPWKIEVHP